MTQLTMKAYDVLDEFINLEVFKTLKQLNKIIEEKYKKEIETFQEAQKAFNEVLDTGGQYHPDYKEKASLLSTHKKALYDKKEMLEYRKLEKEFEDLLNDFLNKMITIISPHIKRRDDFFKGGTCHVR